MICGMRGLTTLLCAVTCLVLVGCGGSQAASTASADTQVNSGQCQTSVLASGPTARSCTFVLNDGRRLGCNRTFNGPTPTFPQLLRDGCRWLAPLKLSRSMSAVIGRIDSGRSCLTSKGLRAVGGPAFPTDPPDAA